MNRHYLAVAERAQYRCEYCGAPERVFNFSFQVEHIVPISQLGPNTLENFALACESCNLYKSDAQTHLDTKSGVEVLLFHPRLQLWQDHFSSDLSTASIHGITPTGRATVARLRMNSEFQLRARTIWIQMGLYP